MGAARRPYVRISGAKKREYRCAHRRSQVRDAGVVPDVQTGARQPAGQLIEIFYTHRAIERRDRQINVITGLTPRMRRH